MKVPHIWSHIFGSTFRRTCSTTSGERKSVALVRTATKKYEHRLTFDESVEDGPLTEALVRAMVEVS